MAHEYAKVILYAYPHLSALAEAVGVGAENKALLSFRGTENTLALAERIAEELALKDRLLRLKEAADKALDCCTEEELLLLEYKYFRRRKVLRERFAAVCVSCSERNYFRRQSALLRTIAARLCMRGWTEERFMQAFGAFPPFRRALAALAEGEEKRLVAHRCKREIAFRSDQKSEDSCAEDFLPRSTSTATATATAQKMQMTAICTAFTDDPPSSSGAGCVSPSPASAAR